jgi:hypothetical protein
MLFRPNFYQSPDTGNGGGTTTVATAASANADGNTPAGTGNDPGNLSGSNNGNLTGAITFASEAEFQKKVDELLKDRLDRQNKKAEETAKKAAADAAAEAAKKNGEWQVLAEQREKELKETAEKMESFEKTQQLAKRYEESLKKNLEVQRTGLPDPITALLDKLDVAEQLEWLAANKATMLKKTPDGITPTPLPDGSNNNEQTKAAKEKFSRETRSYF